MFSNFVTNSGFPKICDCDKFSKSELINYISNVIDKLEQSVVSFDSKSIFDPILRLSTSYFDYYHTFIYAICEIFLEREVVKLIFTFLCKLTDPIDVNDKTVDLIFTWLVNYSDYSEKFAIEIKTSNILQLIIDLILNKNLYDLSNEGIKEFVNLCIIIVNNFARNVDNCVTYRVEEVKQYLVILIKSEIKEIQIISMLTLSYLVNEEDVYLLTEGSNTINNLLTQIQFVMKEDKRSEGFTLYELIHGLRCISWNDDMKEKIVEEGGIPILINILKTMHGKEIEPCLGTIEQLTFNNDIKTLLRNEYQIEEVVKCFENDESAEIRKHYEKIMWKMEYECMKKHEKLAKKEKLVFDVFISYCHANESQIKKIQDKLQRNNIKIWIDTEQIIDSCIEAMAKGIENSNLFLIAYSRCYVKSSNCRLEAEYAARMRKKIIPLRMELKYKPKSWLGLLVGSNLPYEFCGECNMEEQLMKLQKSIRIYLTKSGSTSSDEEIEISTQRECEEIKTNKIKQKTCCQINEIVKRWTNENVLQWLDSSNLGHLKRFFTNVDGSLIPIMLDLRSDCADYFNKTLTKEFGMKFVDVLIFHKALNDLSLVN